MRVSDRGGDAEPLTLPSADGRRSPARLAGAWRRRTRAALHDRDVAARRRAGPDRRDAARRRTRRWQTLVEWRRHSRAAARSSIVAFSRGSELHAVAFDRVRLAIAGHRAGRRRPASRAAQFAVSSAGAMVYARGRHEPRRLARLGVRPPVHARAAASLAALAVARAVSGRREDRGVGRDQTGADIWIGDLERGAMTRLTHGGSTSRRSGARTALGLLRDVEGRAVRDLDPRRFRGGAGRSRCSPRRPPASPVSVARSSRDGRLLACTETGGPAARRYRRLPLSGGPPRRRRSAHRSTRSAACSRRTAVARLSVGRIGPMGNLPAEDCGQHRTRSRPRAARARSGRRTAARSSIAAPAGWCASASTAIAGRIGATSRRPRARRPRRCGHRAGRAGPPPPRRRPRVA